LIVVVTELRNRPEQPNTHAMNRQEERPSRTSAIDPQIVRRAKEIEYHQRDQSDRKHTDVHGQAISTFQPRQYSRRATIILAMSANRFPVPLKGFKWAVRRLRVHVSGIHVLSSNHRFVPNVSVGRC